MKITKKMFTGILPMAQEYIKRLELFWEKQNDYRRKKVRNAADVLTAAYIIWGGDENNAKHKAITIALTMNEAQFDYKKTARFLSVCPKF